MLVTLHELADAARRGGYALGAFNTYNLEISTAIVQAAEEVRAPVIVQTGAAALRGASGVALPALILALARASSVPVAVHLDHCPDLDGIERALAAGYTSVMIDGSAHPLETNIALTREAVARGHAAGVTVEAELGGIGGNEDVAAVSDSVGLTDPASAAHFVAAAGVDLLAVAIGNVHGFYRGDPRLRFELLEELRALLPVPLVLHGASGLSNEALQCADEGGIVKINFNTELRAVFFDALEHYLPQTQAGYDVATLMGRGREAVQSVVAEKLGLLGAAGRAGSI